VHTLTAIAKYPEEHLREYPRTRKPADGTWHWDFFGLKARVRDA